MYKLKHIPTGLYYQPHKHGGSNLSRRGKVYQTATHGLSSAMRNYNKNPEIKSNSIFFVYCKQNSTIHKLTNDILDWVDCSWAYNQIKAETKIHDWVIEEI